MATKKQFIIPKRSHEKPIDFEVVTGTVLSDDIGLFAYNTNSAWSKWCISDIKSGLALQSKFNTLADCKAFVETMPQELIDKIKARQQDPDYLEMCNKIKQQALELSVSNKYYESLNGALNELYRLNEEAISLFESLHFNTLVESVKIDFANEVAELIKKYPERFSNIDAENLAKPKYISIDYLDGCTDITFDTGLGNDDPIADLTGNSTNLLALSEYDDLMREVFKGKIDKWLKAHNLSHEDICWLKYDPDIDQVFLEFNTEPIHEEKEESLIESKEDWINFETWAGKDNVELFKKLQPRLQGQERDMYYWMEQGLDALEARLAELQATPTKAEKDAEASGNAELVYTDNNWLVYYIGSVEAARKYGKGTKWCISAEHAAADGQTAESHWESYILRGADSFFIVINRRNSKDKYCVVHYVDGTKEFWSANDTVIDEIPNGPAFEPVMLTDDIPSIITKSAYIIAEALVDRMTSKLELFKKPKGFRFFLTARYGSATSDKVLRLFANIAASFRQFGTSDELFNLYSSKESYREAIVDEVSKQVQILAGK